MKRKKMSKKKETKLRLVKNEENEDIKFEDIVNAIDEEIYNDEEFMAECIANAVRKSNEKDKILHDVVIDASVEITIETNFKKIQDLLVKAQEQKNSKRVVLNVDYHCSPNFVYNTNLIKNYESAIHWTIICIHSEANTSLWEDRENLRIKIIRENERCLVFDIPDHKIRILLMKVFCMDD